MVPLMRTLFSASSPLGDEITDYSPLDGDPHPLPPGHAGLQAEYERLIGTELKRWGITEACAKLEVLTLSETHDGRDVYAAVLTLQRWQRKSALRLMLGLPLLEKKIRQLIAGQWLADASVFAGLWLHAAGDLQGHAATSELRSLLVTLTGARIQAKLRSEPTRPMPL